MGIWVKRRALSLAIFCLTLASMGLVGNRPLAAQPQEDIPAGITSRTDIPYGPRAAQKLDLYYRPGSKLPLIIFIHGGGWSGGDKSENLARGLVDRGFAVANINYRLVGEAPFPANISDCQSAVRYLRLNAGEYGLDGRRIGVMGQSAGAQLAALLGTAGNYQFSPDDQSNLDARVQAVAEISGATDFALFGSSKPGNGITQFFGAPTAQVPDLVRSASPKTYISKNSPPFLLVHGQKDRIVPIVHLERFRSALNEAGVPVTVKILEGEGHELTPAAWDQVMAVVEKFFVQQLHPENGPKSP